MATVKTEPGAHTIGFDAARHTVFAFLPQSHSAAGHPALRQIAEFDLPGPPGKRFDYLTIDDDNNYLLSAHLGAGLLHVIDLRTNAVVKTVPDVPGVEGVAYIAEGKKVYTANWGENKIGVIDVARMAVVKRLPTEAKPDGIAYAAPFHKAYVSNERAKAESVIDVRTDTIVKVLRFDSETACPSTILWRVRSMSTCKTRMSLR